MTEDEDKRLATKRNKCRDLLTIFHEYYLNGNSSARAGNFVVYMGLLRDMRKGTEQDLDRLIEDIDQKNQEALMKKLTS
jgi:hypothetical protein